MTYQSLVFQSLLEKNCEGINMLLGLWFFKDPTLKKMNQIVVEFESLFEISYTLWAIDGNHILIIVPSVDLASYYCRKLYYVVLLHGVVNCQYLFWDYIFGWARSILNWSLFHNSKIEKTMNELFLPYKTSEMLL